MNIQKGLCAVPFALFFTGYYGASYLFSVSAFTLPSFVGQPLVETVTLLSQFQLHPRVIREQEDPDQDPGTIIYHIPSEGARVKPHQTVFLTITKKPTCHYTPDLVGLSYEQVVACTQRERMRMKWFTVPSVYPENKVIAQSPVAGTPFNSSHIVVYGAQRADTRCIMPDFTGMSVADFYEIIENYGLRGDCYTLRGDRCRSLESVIRQQRPLPGSFIDMHDPQTIRVIVEER